MEDPISVSHSVSAALNVSQNKQTAPQTGKAALMWDKPLSAQTLEQKGYLLNHASVAKAANNIADKVATNTGLKRKNIKAQGDVNTQTIDFLRTGTDNQAFLANNPVTQKKRVFNTAGSTPGIIPSMRTPGGGISVNSFAGDDANTSTSQSDTAYKTSHEEKGWWDRFAEWWNAPTSYGRTVEDSRRGTEIFIQQAHEAYAKGQITKSQRDGYIAFAKESYATVAGMPFKTNGEITGAVAGIAGGGVLAKISKVRVFHIPQGLSKTQFNKLSQSVRSKARELGLGDDIFVQGSRANGTAKATSDIDIAIRVSPEKFDNFLYNQSKLRKVNPGSAKAKTRDHAIQTGKIQSGEAGLSSLRKQLEKELGMEVDLSVIKAGGKFDNGSQLHIR